MVLSLLRALLGNMTRGTRRVDAFWNRERIHVRMIVDDLAEADFRDMLFDVEAEAAADFPNLRAVTSSVLSREEFERQSEAEAEAEAFGRQFADRHLIFQRADV